MKSNKQRVECYPEKYSQNRLCLHSEADTLEDNKKTFMVDLAVNNLFTTK